jgi:hypothetical protein
MALFGYTPLLRENIQCLNLMGVLTGVLLTVLGVFVLDNLAVANAPSGTEPQKIVNWDVAAQKLRSSIATMKEEVREVRQDVHEATR